MDKKANDTFAFDLENRLDDFFSDALPPEGEASGEGAPPAGSRRSLKDLKSIILALDWEITDEVLAAFIAQVETLAGQYEDDKVVHTLLKLLKSLGKYIRAQKSKAHPDTIKRLMAVYAALEESLTNDGLQMDKREKMVLEEVRQFLRLKHLIFDTQPVRPRAAAPRPTPPPADPDYKKEIATLYKAVEDLKRTMTKELAALRKELAQLRKK